MNINHCPTCGALTKQIQGNKYKCLNCEKEHYVNPKVCVGAILFTDKHHVLMARRANDPHKGTLDCLGGFVDMDESLEQAMLRELKEEAGLEPDDLIDLQYVGSGYDMYPWEDDQIPVVSAFFATHIRPGVTVNADDDVDSLEVYKLKDLPLDEIAFESVRRIYSEL